MRKNLWGFVAIATFFVAMFMTLPFTAQGKTSGSVRAVDDTPRPVSAPVSDTIIFVPQPRVKLSYTD